MAKHQWLTPHQKGIVRRYYDNRDNMMHQKLAEIVSELALCEDEKKANKLWKSARTALLNSGVHEAKVQRVIEPRDLEGLAELVNEMF
jgi:hypothetical protein